MYEPLLYAVGRFYVGEISAEEAVFRIPCLRFDVGAHAGYSADFWRALVGLRCAGTEFVPAAGNGLSAIWTEPGSISGEQW